MRTGPEHAAALVVVAAFAISPASSGTISLESRTVCSVESAIRSSDEVEDPGQAAGCEVSVSNRGDEVARNLRLEVGLADASNATSVGMLAPGETRAIDLTFELSPLSPGRFPVIVTIRYEDREGYPLSTVAYSELEFDGGGADSDLQIDLEPIALERLAVSRTLVVQNSGSKPRRARLNWVLPDEIRVDPRSIELAVEPGEERRLVVQFANRGALPGSRYGIAVVAYDESGRSVVAAHNTQITVSNPLGPTVRHRWLTLGLLALLFLAGLVAMRTRDDLLPARRVVAARLFEGLIVGVSVLFVLIHLRPDLLSLQTIATGGDTASHYATADYLQNVLLPEGRVLGWAPGNLAGFPVFQLYFPLPFLLMMPLASWLTLPIAFKWVTVAGSLLLPLAAFVSLRALGFARPIPALAAVSTLPFLFQEGNSVWGGNLLSTLAGEFTYSFALSLVLVFVGLAYRALILKRGWVGAAMVLAAIGLSHAYALLFAASWLVLASLWARNLRDALLTVVKIGGLAACVIGFWIVPLLAYSGYTSPYADQWSIGSWQQLVPPLLWPAALLTVLALAGSARRFWSGRGVDPRIGVLWSGFVAVLALYSVAQPLGTVDIRFLPFAQVGLGLVGAVLLGGWLRASQRPVVAGLASVVFLIAAAGAVDRAVDQTPSWVQWNYSGYENRRGWDDFRAVNEHLRGDQREPRVVFEHASEHNAVGSIRAFESLPYFSGRSTLEGLYIQSSHLTPQIFYLQSEFSRVASCPLPDFHCTAPDLGRAADHMRLFNVGQVVARTPEIRGALRGSPEFSSEGTFGSYEVFRVEGNEDRYVVPLRTMPIEVDAEDWRRLAFRAFTRPGGDPAPMVETRGGARVGRSIESMDAWLATKPRPAPTTTDSFRVREEIGHHRIEIETDQPGHPLLIKVAYHPRWRARTGEEVLRASPGFLLVYPNAERVVLEFSETAWTLFGKALTALGVLALFVLALRRCFGEGSPVADTGAPVSSRFAPIGHGLVAGLLLVAMPWIRSDFAPRHFDAAMELYRAESFDAARERYGVAIRTSPLSSAAVSAHFYRGLSAFRQQRCDEAVDLLEKMLLEFPDSKYREESEFHVGVCRERLGQPLAAVAAYRELATRSPESAWGVRAAESLRRLAHEIS